MTNFIILVIKLVVVNNWTCINEHKLKAKLHFLLIKLNNFKWKLVFSLHIMKSRCENDQTRSFLNSDIKHINLNLSEVFATHL